MERICIWSGAICRLVRLQSVHDVLLSFAGPMLALFALFEMVSLRGGMRSFILSKYLASSNPWILCDGLKPLMATKNAQIAQLNLFCELFTYVIKHYMNRIEFDSAL